MGVLGVYCRISNKRDNYSMGEQKRMGIEVCENNGFDYKIYEEVESGVKGKVGRKYFKEMMSLVEEGVLDGVVIYNVDRFLRDKRVSIEVEDIYEENDGFELYVDGIKREIGEYENDKDWWEYEVSRSGNEIRSMRRKFFMGLKKSYRDGLSYGGGRRYGFIRVKDRKSEKRIIVNEEQKEIIVYLHKILNGKKYIKNITHLREIIFEKFEVNIYYAKLIRLITDETYYSGIMKTTFMGEEYSFEVDKMITKDVFDKSNRRYIELKGKRKGRDKKDYLLKGKVYCGGCGERSYILGSGKSDGKDYKYYSCSSFIYADRIKLNKKGGCDIYKKNTINMKILDNVVWEMLFRVLSNIDVVKKEYLKKYDNKIGENKKFKGRLKYGEDRLKDLEKEEIEVLKNLGKSGLDSKRLKLIISDFDERKEKILDDIKRYEKENKKYKNKEIVSDYLDLMKIDLDRRKNVDISNRKDEINRYVERVCVERMSDNDYNIDLKLKIEVSKEENDSFVDDVIKMNKNNFYIKNNHIYKVDSYIERIILDIKCNVLINNYIRGRDNLNHTFKIDRLGFDIK
tara:strand:- start:181 stop:1887 length:1707 start_codon:yes stop_codon:yes gene_type:complete